MCIYCGGSDGKLTDEHPVPNAFGGRHILPKASCGQCQKIINEEVEQYCLSTLLGVPRVYFELRSHKRPPRRQSLRVKRPDGKIERIQVSPEDMPLIAALPCFPLPTILENRAPTSTFHGQLWAHMPHQETLAALGAEALVSESIDPGKFARFLAKMAYCHGIAALGIDAFVPSLPSIIFGRNVYFTEYVGGFLGPFPVEDGHVMKMGIIMYERPTDHHQLAAVQMQLFPHIGGPEYVVVLGEFLKPWPLDGRSRSAPR